MHGGGVVGLLAVGGVEVGPNAGVVALDGRLLVGAGPRDVDGVVRRRGVDLEAEGIQQQLAEGVVGDVVLRVSHIEDVDQRLDLGLGSR